MSEWTPEALAEYEAWRQQRIDQGICPNSGYTIRRCIRSDLCDCFDYPEIRAEIHGLMGWDPSAA